MNRDQLPSPSLGRHCGARQLSCRTVRNMTLEFGRGWTAIVGPNGAGKSTLLRCLAGLLVPSAGEALYAGRPITRWDARELSRKVVWVDQSARTTGHLTVADTVALGRLPHRSLPCLPPRRGHSADDEQAIALALEQTGTAHLTARRLDRLSGGERQRVLLARALATGSETLLLDEPNTHLDPVHQVELARQLRSLAATRCVVTVLHDLSLALLADRVIAMDDGRLVADGLANDTRLHRALETAFGHAIRIDPDASAVGLNLARRA